MMVEIWKEIDFVTPSLVESLYANHVRAQAYFRNRPAVQGITLA